MEVSSIIVLVIGGLGAGILTGFIGASAVLFIAGFLLIFTNYDPYFTIGLSLIVDFFAAITSVYFYGKSRNIKLKHGLFIAIIATIFSLIGGYFSRVIPHKTLGAGFSVVILVSAISFLINPLKLKNKKIINYFDKRKKFASIFFGIIIGLTTGIFGVGGGLFIAMVLLYSFDYNLKNAVGTSVFIMAFLALSGGIGHFLRIPSFPVNEIIIASIGGILGAAVSSVYANRVNERKLFKISGFVLLILSVVVFIMNFKGY